VTNEHLELNFTGIMIDKRPPGNANNKDHRDLLEFYSIYYSLCWLMEKTSFLGIVLVTVSVCALGPEGFLYVRL